MDAEIESPTVRILFAVDPLSGRCTDTMPGMPGTIAVREKLRTVWSFQKRAEGEQNRIIPKRGARMPGQGTQDLELAVLSRDVVHIPIQHQALRPSTRRVPAEYPRENRIESEGVYNQILRLSFLGYPGVVPVPRPDLLHSEAT